MSFLTKGIVIRGKDLISVTVFMAFTGSFAVTLRAVTQFIYFESFGAPPSLILIIPPSFASGAIFGGFLLDRVRRRKPFFLLFFAWAFVPFLPIIFKAVSIIPIHLAATGILQGLTYPAVRSFLADVTEVYDRGRVAGLGWSGMGLLSIIMVFVVSWSLDMFFALYGVLGVAMGLVGLILVEERVSLEDWRRVPTKSIFDDKNFLIFLGMAGIIGFWWGSNAGLVGNYATGIIANPRVTFNIVLFSIYVITGFFAGVLLDRLGRRPVIIIGAIFFASSFVVFIFYSGFWTFLLIAASFGIGYSCTNLPLAEVVFGDLARKEARGRSYAMGLASIALGSMLGSSAGVLLASSSATVIATLTVFAAFLIILPTTIARETLPPKEKVEEMLDYIKEIEEETSKDEDNSP